MVLGNVTNVRESCPVGFPPLYSRYVFSRWHHLLVLTQLVCTLDLQLHELEDQGLGLLLLGSSNLAWLHLLLHQLLQIAPAFIDIPPPQCAALHLWVQDGAGQQKPEAERGEGEKNSSILGNLPSDFRFPSLFYAVHQDVSALFAFLGEKSQLVSHCLYSLLNSWQNLPW